MSVQSNQQKILLTGAAGCIGSWVIKQCLDNRHDIVAVDISDQRSRLELLVGQDRAHSITWDVCDIRNKNALLGIAKKHEVNAIIHLAALQVPFCKADATLGAEVNVVGTINVFEVARTLGIKRIAYASSVAATAMFEKSTWLKTLYGAYKICNEQTAKVYWQDYNIPSVGIRPSVIYGVSRDQGMSALPSIAILASCLQQPFNISFRGHVGFVYAANIAHALIQSVKNAHSDAHVFDYNGIQLSVEDFVKSIKKRLPTSNITITGGELPFPSDMSNQPLIDHIGEFEEIGIEDGITETIQLFQSLVKSGQLNLSHLK